MIKPGVGAFVARTGNFVAFASALKHGCRNRQPALLWDFTVKGNNSGGFYIIFRRSTGKIVQFNFGDDGLDVSKTEGGKINVQRIVREVKANV